MKNVSAFSNHLSIFPIDPKAIFLYFYFYDWHYKNYFIKETTSQVIV